MKTIRKQSILTAALTCALAFTTTTRTQAQAVGTAEAQVIAQEAYVYFYPLVIMDVSRKHFTNIEAGKMFARGPMNTFSHARTFPPATFRGATHANFDTLYSVGWLDLTEEPVIISVPDAHGRYYLLQLLDMWTDSFAGIGKRTTGTGAGDFAVVGPGWQGELPQGLQRINAPTPFVWVIGRTRTDGPQDYDAVHKLQDGYKMTLLSQWGKPPQAITAKIDPSVADAQKQYSSEPHDGEPAGEYALKLASDPGKHNGLYWKAAAGEPQSSMGPLIAQAVSEGYGGKGPTPFRGYIYRRLERQGPDAPGGAKEYIVDGKKTGGFAFLAYPAEYRNSGVMTFIVNQDGIVYQKDLGPDTAKTAQSMTEFNPDKSWQPVQD